MARRGFPARHYEYESDRANIHTNHVRVDFMETDGAVIPLACLSPTMLSNRHRKHCARKELQHLSENAGYSFHGWGVFFRLVGSQTPTVLGFARPTAQNPNSSLCSPAPKSVTIRLGQEWYLVPF